MEDRRRLRRIENRFGSDLNCLVQTVSSSISCEVVDFNSLGLRIRCNSLEESDLIAKSSIKRATISYGTMDLGNFHSPTVKKNEGQSLELILLPKVQIADPSNAREERANIPELFEPLVVGHDPVRIKETLVMRIDNISSKGFRAKSSLSNRHLFQGQLLENFIIYLPSIGEMKVSFRVLNMRHSEGFLYLGCQFEQTNREDDIKVKSFLLLCLLSSQNNSDSAERTDLLPRKISSILRVRRVDSREDFQEVLKLRHEAYSGAHKLTEDSTVQDMEDEFDQNSVVLGAFMGKKLVGTIRIVFSKGESKFPFEKYFDFFSGSVGEREKYVEVSKLAISPRLQGGDVLFRLFQVFAIEFMPKREYALLMATDSLAKNYISIGAKRISGSCPHPVLKDESLSLYLLETQKLKDTKMSALAWFFFGREIHQFMSKFGFTPKTGFQFFKMLRLPIEIAPKLVRKVLKKFKTSLAIKAKPRWGFDFIPI